MSELGWSQYEELPIDEEFEYGTRFAISDFFDSQNMRCSIIRFDPGEGGPLHYHNKPTEEYYYVLDGKLDIQMGDEIVEADPGTVLYTPSEKVHQPRNNYDEPALLMSVLSPNRDKTSADEGGVEIVEDAD